ncbi:major facilitator superfamily domain-containing protein [Penicillium waksmanii]|uniref:major facilitator superfamily domain-containing protein n=1 Tax=Penicillium waksmanii TaxID=69791 RepID=UPI002547AA15|nr:major facilitator superfamily domain-containing protein [Penicillium waksmanii]KAJ5980009.1 major facilitator superfamily domain-containing protein [Penicillium waksmanii]
MFCVGTVYALTVLQTELSRLLGVSEPWSVVPFGAACLGLCVGVSTCASLMTQRSVHLVAAWGTMLWGFAVAIAGAFLSKGSFVWILFSLLLGGIGVGWTYLAVVVLVGRAFPNHMLARSAIGPMGFSSGTAACIALGSVFDFTSLDAKSLGTGLTLAGSTFIMVAAVTMISLHIEEDIKRKSPSFLKAKSESEVFFSTLLFFNALPGMVIFDALLPFASYHTQGMENDPLKFLPYAMIALFSGGLLAPSLNSILGPKITFAGLFSLRGFSLVLLSQFSNTNVSISGLLLCLFGHGAGFSIIPSLIKAKQEHPASFPSSYGRVLVNWGIAGVVGCILNGVLGASFGNSATVGLVIGVISLSFSAALYILPSFGDASLMCFERNI